jgi:hypothetical protein
MPSHAISARCSDSASTYFAVTMRAKRRGEPLDFGQMCGGTGVILIPCRSTGRPYL